MIFYHIQESNDQLIILNRDDFIQILLDIWENMRARSLNCSTICNGVYMGQCNNLTFLKRSLHTGCTCWLYTDYFNMRIKKLGKCGYTCCKSASTDWHQNIIYKRKLLNDLHSNGSLAGSNCRIIKRMNKGIALFFSKLQSICTGLIINITMKNNLCAIPFCTLYFNKRCSGRHYDHGLHTVFVCRICHTLCMISSGSCDQTFASLLVGKSTDLIISSTHLICTCSLHVLWFEEDLVSSEFREITALHQLGLLGYLLNYFCRFFKTL